MFNSRVKILILDVGNRLRGSDGFGSILTEKLKAYQNQNLKIIDCGEVPENYLREIFDFKPDCIVILDTIYTPGRNPGEILLLKDIQDESSISTHCGSLKLFLDALGLQGLKKFYSFVLGVIPREVKMGEVLSEQVQSGIENIFREFPKYFEIFSSTEQCMEKGFH